MKWIEQLKAQRVAEVRQAVAAFLTIYPEAGEVFAEMVSKPEPAPHRKPPGLPATLPTKPTGKPFEAKLSADQIQSIRADLMAGVARQQIADKYGVSSGFICNIGVGRSRKSVPMSNEFRAWVAQRVATIKRGRGRPKKRK
jgi:hypothetical protein